jgi:hypothetical protein
VPVPPNRPYACDGAVLPVRELSHFLGSRSGGVETPFERSGFFQIKSLYSFLMQELLALYSSGAMNAAAPKQGTPAADW